MTASRSFGENFTPAEWQGCRRRHFEKHEDVFQQLVSDALKSVFYDHAIVTTTSGQDGSIDAWVKAGAAPQEQRFEHFEFPCIVECKHHDGGSDNLADNIEQGWTKVRQKLKKQADAGWPGNYSPWREARGYLYCISARFPSPDAKLKFEKKIRVFFAEELASLSIAESQIRVWDWSDLTGWLRASRRLADEWLGIGFDTLQGHAEYRQDLSGFHTYLLSENLPFIAPEADDPACPAKLYARVRQGENLMLAGEGGVGKTRTAFEVAELAQRDHWRVVHLRQSDRPFDPRELEEELLLHGGDTLVVVDYIDQFQNFDFAYWTRTVLPAANQRNARIVLLTNARPLGAKRLLESLRGHSLLAEVRLSPAAERREKIAAGIEAIICPEAIGRLGQVRVRELCGNRPIIAMLVARELERLEKNGELDDGSLPRPGDLTGWILRRLGQDELLPPSAPSCWDEPELPPHLAAATAILAACPMQESELIATAAATLGKFPDLPPGKATFIVGVLQKTGWLEQDGYQWRTPHDAVADEILRATVAQYPKAFPVIFAGAALGRPLGRFAVSLGRLAGLGDGGDAASAVSWLRDEAEGLGQALADVRPDDSAYALGALFDYPPWSAVALESWESLIAPWLASHAGHLAARHVLYRGLKQVPEAALPRLRVPAYAWLDAYPMETSASLVLAPLLENAAAMGGELAKLLGLAMDWLKRHGETEEAGFVLPPLLASPSSELRKRDAELLGWAMDWLKRHGETEEAGFVLAPLLASPSAELRKRDGELLGWAMDLLKCHAGTEEAQFVFHSLLSSPSAELRKRDAELLGWAMDWLKYHDGTEEARFVLPPLLASPSAELRKRDAELLGWAMDWMKRHAETEEAGFVLAPLLSSPSAELRKRDAELLGWAMDWLERHAETKEAGFVLAPLLSSRSAKLRKRDDELLVLTAAWLNRFAETEAATFVFPPFLENTQLHSEMLSYWSPRALDSYKKYRDNDDATHMLAVLLRLAGHFRLEVPAKEIVVAAGAWLDDHKQHPERLFVLARLLRIKWFPQDVWEASARAGFLLLESRPVQPADDYALNALSARLESLDEGEQQRWLGLACRWLETCANPKNGSSLLLGCKKFFHNGVPDQVKSALGVIYARRFSDADWDWTHPTP